MTPAIHKVKRTLPQVTEDYSQKSEGGSGARRVPPLFSWSNFTAFVPVFSVEVVRPRAEHLPSPPPPSDTGAPKTRLGRFPCSRQPAAAPFN